MILNNAEGIYLGNNEVQKIYKGETLVYEKQNNSGGLTIPADYILALDFNGDFVDKTGNYTMLGVDSYPTFEPGRNARQSVRFSKNCTLKTLQNLSLATTEITVSFWVNFKYSTIAKQEVLLNFYEGSPNGFILERVHSKNLRVLIYKYYSPSVYTSIILENNTWINIVATFSNIETKIYADGILKSVINKGLDNEALSPKPLRLGRKSDSSYDFTGLMQDLRIYNRVLSDAEIQSLYNE